MGLSFFFTFLALIETRIARRKKNVTSLASAQNYQTTPFAFGFLYLHLTRKGTAIAGEFGHEVSAIDGLFTCTTISFLSVSSPGPGE